MFRRLIVLFVLAHGLTPALCAQPADGVGAQARTALQGIWSTHFTAPDHPAWNIEDHFCNFGAAALSFCPPIVREHLRTLLADPANDNRPLTALMQEAMQVRIDFLGLLMTDAARERRSRYDPDADPANRCSPPELIALLMAPLPVAIDVHDDRVIFQYDGSDTLRTIKIAGEGPPSVDRPTLLGSSSARFEGATLIVESRDIAGSTSRFLTTADGTRTVERYTSSNDGTRLNLELTIDDPASFREPLVLLHSRVRTPDEKILGTLPCEANQDNSRRDFK